MRGSRRNHIRWRRANARVRRTVVAKASSMARRIRRSSSGRASRRRGSPRTRSPGGRCATGRRAPRASRATSSTRPAGAHGRDPARRSAPRGRARGNQIPAMRTGKTVGPYASTPGPNDENGRPVSRITSSARTMRRTLCGSMRAAAVGVGGARARAYAAATPPGSAVRASSSARSARSSPGKLEVVDDRLHVEAGAADEQRAAAACLDRRRPRRAPRPGCGRPTSPRSDRRRRSGGARTAARSAGVGLAVPMSIPR